MPVKMESIDIFPSRKSSKEDVEYEYVAPDGGWAWFVLGGSVIVNFFITGLLKCYGVLLVEIFDAFDASPTSASWISSLAHFLFLSLGPLANYVSRRFGFRACTAAGALFAAAGLILSSLATRVEHLYLSLGILYGVGSGLLFPLGVIIVNAYFHRRRGFAMGVAFGGSPLGTFFLPPFLTYLTVIFGFRGAVLIMGGLTLHVLIAAIVYVPVKRHLVKVRVHRSNPNSEPYKTSDVIDMSEKQNNTKDKHAIYKTLQKSEDDFKSGVGLLEERIFSSTDNSESPVLNRIWEDCAQNVRERRTSTRSFKFSGFPEEKEEKVKKENIYALLFRDPVFYVMITSHASTAIGYTNFAMFLPAFAQSLGFDKDKGSYLLSIIAVFDLVGRIGGGTISDWFLSQKKYYFMFGVFFSGVFMTAVSVSSLYSHIAVLCAFFGLTAGIYIGNTGVVMADILGDDKLAHCYTTSLFVKGVIHLVSPPLCGFFYERIGSFRPVFQVFGVCHMIGASILFLTPWLKKK